MKSRICSIVSILLAVLLTLGMTGCGKPAADTGSEESAPTEKATVYINPLTGMEMDADAVNQRPVALMVNNIKTAQSVQTGLNDADIVYEAYAEGGITRLLAIYKDISKVGNIGTIRSGRYSHVDLAAGHDAIYVHCGLNETHAAPHIKELGMDNFDLGKRNYGFRVKNGKATEHTLYTSGEKLTEGFEKLSYRTELKTEDTNWQSFVSAEDPVVPGDGSCDAVSVNMSASSNTTFKYDHTTGRYVRYSGSTLLKDYNSGESITFKNILVLKTDVTFMDSQKYIEKTGLDGGEGYYLSNGGYQSVKWSKGDATDSLKITLPDGSDCPYNVGNTWVCLVDKDNAVTLTPGATAATEESTTK